MKQVKVNESTDKMLTEISEKRKSENSFIRTKQDVVAEAISLLHKKEMRNSNG